MKNDKNKFAEEIARTEEAFIKLGAKRMSEYYGAKIFKNRISAEHVLWIPGENGYYHVDAKKENGTINILVSYSERMDHGFEDYSKFEYIDEEKSLHEVVNGLIHGILPKEEEILNMYIDIDDEPFEPDIAVITKDMPIDCNLSITLKKYLDPHKKSEVLADYARKSYENNKDSVNENNIEPLQDLLESFFGYWDSNNYEKMLSAAVEINNAVRKYLPDNSYLNALAELYELISLYLTDDYVSVRTIGEKLLTESTLSDESLLIIPVLDYLSSTYYALGQTERAIELAEAGYKIRKIVYGVLNAETIWAKIKCNLYRGIDRSPQKAIEEANNIYKHFLKTEGKNGDNTAAALSNLSYMLSSFGAYNQSLMAECMLYKIFEQKYGRDDRLTLFSLQDMAVDISYIDENGKDAEILAKYAYNRAALKYGMDSKEAASALSVRADIFSRSGAVGRAMGFQERSYKIIEKIYGPSHPRTMMKKEVLSEAYLKASKYDRTSKTLEKAWKLDNEIYEWKKRVFGEDDKLTIDIEEKIIFDKYLLGEKQEALELQNKLINRCEKIFGPDDFASFGRYLKCSFMESGLELYERALATDQYLLKKLRNVFDDSHPYIQQTVENIVYDMINLGELEKASEYAYEAAVHRVEILGQYNESTQRMIGIYSDIKQQLSMVVHYFNYHVPKYMGFDLQLEEEGYVINYSEGDGSHDQINKTANVEKENVEKLISILNPALSWNKNYEGERCLNGEGFELEVRHKDIHIDSSGKFAFPENYERLHENVICWLDQVLE